MLNRRAKRSPKIVLALLGTVIACGAAWLVLRPVPAPPPVVLHPTARQVAQVQTHFDSLRQAVTSPGPSARTLRLSENDLNVYLASSRSAQKLLTAHGVQSVQIVLQEPCNVVVHAAVRVHDAPQNVLIDGTLAPDPQTGLRFTASRARVGSFPLPASVITSQANALAARLTGQFHHQLPLSVQSVTVQKKDLVIVGFPQAPVSPQSASPGRH